ncbi:MAG: hypothetical protein QXW18_06415 [Candidatus Bathyarchaeia archaeon]
MKRTEELAEMCEVSEGSIVCAHQLGELSIPFIGIFSLKLSYDELIAAVIRPRNTFEVIIRDLRENFPSLVSEWSS